MEKILPKLKKYQKKYSFSYSFGAYPTLDLLKYRKDSALEVVLKADGLKSDGVAEVMAFCKKENIPCEVNDRLIEKIAYKENTYVLGAFEKYECDLDEEGDHMVLVEPSNMGNLGTVIRTMLGFGFKDLALIRPAADIFDPKVVRSTMGAVFQINFRYFDSIEKYLEEYTGHNVYTFMLDGATEITEVDFKSPISFVHGNEGRGLEEKYKGIGKSVYIPHSKDIDSLNLSVAAAIGLWESRRAKK